MLNSFFKDFKSKQPGMKKILKNQLLALFKLKREQLNLALLIMESPADSLTKSLTKDSSVIASVFLFLDKYEVKMPKADLKHSNFTDQKLEGLSRFLNRFFNPALLLSDGHKRLINSIQPDFTLFFESFLKLKSNYQDFSAQSETLFSSILDGLPDAKFSPLCRIKCEGYCRIFRHP